MICITLYLSFWILQKNKNFRITKSWTTFLNCFEWENLLVRILVLLKKVYLFERKRTRYACVCENRCARWLLSAYFFVISSSTMKKNFFFLNAMRNKSRFLKNENKSEKIFVRKVWHGFFFSFDKIYSINSKVSSRPKNVRTRKKRFKEKRLSIYCVFVCFYC